MRFFAFCPVEAITVWKVCLFLTNLNILWPVVGAMKLTYHRNQHSMPTRNLQGQRECFNMRLPFINQFDDNKINAVCSNRETPEIGEDSLPL